MATNIYVYRMRKFLTIAVLLMTSLLAGCNLIVVTDAASSTGLDAEYVSEYEHLEYDYNELDHYAQENNEIAASYSFFGIWILEEVVLRRYHEGELELPAPPALRPVVEDFVGYELEITSTFVRLGERTLFQPEYRLSKMREEWFFFSNEHVWKPAYYNSPDEFIEAMRRHGIEIGREDEVSGNVYLEMVFITYPQYPQFWHQGWFLDPDLELNSVFNPLFQSLLILNDNYMLVGTTNLVLARRIC